MGRLQRQRQQPKTVLYRSMSTGSFITKRLSFVGLLLATSMRHHTMMVCFSSNPVAGATEDLELLLRRKLHKISRKSSLQTHLEYFQAGEKYTIFRVPRGGATGDMSDQDLDDYIDFLLAYADDRAMESDNPLFKSLDSSQLKEQYDDNKKLKEDDEAEINERMQDGTQDLDIAPVDKALDSVAESEGQQIDISDTLGDQTDSTEIDIAHGDNEEHHSRYSSFEDSVLSFAQDLEVDSFAHARVGDDELGRQKPDIVEEETMTVAPIEKEIAFEELEEEDQDVSDTEVLDKDMIDSTVIEPLIADDVEDVGQIDEMFETMTTSVDNTAKEVDTEAEETAYERHDFSEIIDTSREESDKDTTESAKLLESSFESFKETHKVTKLEHGDDMDTSDSKISCIFGKELESEGIISRRNLDNGSTTIFSSQDISTESPTVEKSTSTAENAGRIMHVMDNTHGILEDEATDDALKVPDKVSEELTQSVDCGATEAGITTSRSESYTKSLWKKIKDSVKAPAKPQTVNDDGAEKIRSDTSAFNEMLSPVEIPTKMIHSKNEAKQRDATTSSFLPGQYFDKAQGVVRRLLNKPRGYGVDSIIPLSEQPSRRDYTHVFEKYFVQQQSEDPESAEKNLENQETKLQLSVKKTLVRPWGMLLNYFRNNTNSDGLDETKDRIGTETVGSYNDTKKEHRNEEEGVTFMKVLKPSIEEELGAVSFDSRILNSSGADKSNLYDEGISETFQAYDNEEGSVAARLKNGEWGIHTEDYSSASDKAVNSIIYKLSELRKDKEESEEGFVSDYVDVEASDAKELHQFEASEFSSSVFSEETTLENESIAQEDPLFRNDYKDVDLKDQGIKSNVLEETEEGDDQQDHAVEDKILELVEETIDEIEPRVDEREFEEDITLPETNKKTVLETRCEDEAGIPSTEDIEDYSHRVTGVDQENSLEVIDAAFEDDDSENENVTLYVEEEHVDQDDKLTEFEVEHDKLVDLIPSGMSLDKDKTNFLCRFLISKGLEQFVMTAVVILEWFRIYVIAPIIDSATWFIEENPRRGLLRRSIKDYPWRKIQGGSQSSSVDSEDSTQQVGVKRNNGATLDMKENSSETGSTSDPAEQSKEINAAAARNEKNVQSARLRPNRLYRMLLSYGYIGHVLIMECIIASNWFKIYVPALPSILNYIAYDILRLRRDYVRASGEPLTSRTSGFLSSDGTAVRAGRKKKALLKKEDQRALNQLKRLGNVNEAKYHYLSKSFMERHSLGSFALSSEIEVKFDDRIEGIVSISGEDDAAESDAEWILNALAQDDDINIDEGVLDSPFDTNMGLTFGSDGPKMRVGVEFSLGNKARKRSRKRSASISSMARHFETSAKATKKSSGPRLSDRDSGVMGRLRAAGANSIMGRNILGAYPGDLPPPQEAASAKGLIDLARRYGYGDWSDSDIGHDKELPAHDFGSIHDGSEADERGFRSTSKSTRRRKTKMMSSEVPTRKHKRKKSSRDNSIGIGFEVDVSSTAPNISSPKASARGKKFIHGAQGSHHVEQESNSVPGTDKSSNKSVIENGKSLKNHREILSSAKPLEQVNALQKRNFASRRTKFTSTSDKNHFSKKKTKPIRPATSLLEEVRTKALEKDKQDKDV